MATYWSDMYDQKTCLYRFFAADGRLLYVGISMNFRARLDKHRRRTWWPEVADQSLEWFPDRESAQRAERRAIHDENPAYNLVRPRMECC